MSFSPYCMVLCSDYLLDYSLCDIVHRSVWLVSTETCFTPASNKLLVLISPPTCIDWPSVVEEKNVYSSHSLWPHLAYYVTTNTAIRSFHYHFPVTWSQKWRRGLIGLDQICLFFTHFAFLFCSNFLPILHPIVPILLSITHILLLIKNHVAHEWWLHKIWYNDNLVNSISRNEHMALWLHTGMQLVAI